MLIFSEIPSGTKKCCSACFQRITRKISQLSSSTTNSPINNDNSKDKDRENKDKDVKVKVEQQQQQQQQQAEAVKEDKESKDRDSGKKEAKKQQRIWSEDEVDQLKLLLKNHGRNWSVIAKKMSSVAAATATTATAITPEAAKKFFDENRKKHGLDKIVLEYKKVRRGIIIIIHWSLSSWTPSLS